MTGVIGRLPQEFHTSLRHPVILPMAVVPLTFPGPGQSLRDR
jgi:hypothetical protein